MSACVWSIGIDVIENSPSSRPHCKAISSDAERHRQHARQVARPFVPQGRQRIGHRSPSSGVAAWRVASGEHPPPVGAAAPFCTALATRHSPLASHDGTSARLAVDERLVPQLRRQHADQAHLDGGPLQAAGPQPAVALAPAAHRLRRRNSRSCRSDSSLSSCSTNGGAWSRWKLSNGARNMRLAAPGDLARQPALGQPAAAGTSRAGRAASSADATCARNVEHRLVEERVARLDRGVHGHAVALGVEQQARQVARGRSGTARG